MSDDKTGKDEAHDTQETAPESAESQQETAQTGPQFNESPDPLAGVKKGANDILDSMEGKSVSMKTYVGTIIGVVILMLLARCGG